MQPVLQSSEPALRISDGGPAHQLAHHLCASALQLETVQASAVSDYMRRFCSRMGMPHEDIKACVDIADKACPRDGSRQAPEHPLSAHQHRVHGAHRFAWGVLHRVHGAHCIVGHCCCSKCAARLSTAVLVRKHDLDGETKPVKATCWVKLMYLGGQLCDGSCMT